MVVITSRLADISMNMPISLGLIDVDSGMEISSVSLIPCSGFLVGSVMIPNTTFQYQLRGTDVRGIAFEQTSSLSVSPTPFDERSIIQLDCPIVTIPTVTTAPTPGGAVGLYSVKIVYAITAAVILSAMASIM